MWILPILLLITITLLTVILVKLGKNKESYIKVPGQGYVKVPSLKPPIPSGILPYERRLFKNPDNWEIYRNIAQSANSSCGQISQPDDAAKCQKAFPIPILKK
jgi:hypothetical protein